MSNAFALLLLSTAACSTAEAGGGHRDETPYSCDGIVASPQVPDIDPKVVAPWHELATARDLDIVWAFRAELHSYVEVPPLTVRGKIQLQHQMLRVAQRLDHSRRENPIFHRAHQAVMERVRAVAPPKTAFATLDGARPYIRPILGDGIIERATATCGEGNSIHAGHFGGLVAFRPVRTDTTRALVAQIVAFDDEGTPHITPVVEGIELRRGDTAKAPACVVQARLDGTLQVTAHAQIEEHPPFVIKSGNGLTCNQCHSTGAQVGAYDLNAHEVADVDRKRDGQVVRLATHLWKSLEWKQSRGTVAVRSTP